QSAEGHGLINSPTKHAAFTPEPRWSNSLSCLVQEPAPNAGAELTVYAKARMAAEAVRSSLLRFCFSAFLHFFTSLFYSLSCFFHGSTRLFFGLLHRFIEGLAGFFHRTLTVFRLGAGAKSERRESDQRC